MKVAVKQNPIGKPQNNFDARQITFGWNNTDMAPTAVVAHIVSGMPFAVAHFQDGHRKSANFMTSECIALDADGIFDDRLNATRPFTEAGYFDGPFAQSISWTETSETKRDYSPRVSDTDNSGCSGESIGFCPSVTTTSSNSSTVSCN